MSFSERYGYTSKKIQIESIDSNTRNLLWNQLHLWILSYSRNYVKESKYAYDSYDKGKHFFRSIWTKFFILKRNSYIFEEYDYYETIISTCDRFLDDCVWYKYFDFIEFVLNKFEIFSDADNYEGIIGYFTEEINNIFDQQKCQYRLVNNLIVPIGNDGELRAIDAAIADTDSISTVNSHLKRALTLFADRESPDYRNSIKESISALESLFKIIAGLPKATLSDAIKEVRKSQSIIIHPSLLSSINSLYGWAGDEDGLRHAQKKESTVDIEDAQLVLVTCCGLVSYLVSKSIKVNIKLDNR